LRFFVPGFGPVDVRNIWAKIKTNGKYRLDQEPGKPTEAEPRTPKTPTASTAGHKGLGYGKSRAKARTASRKVMATNAWAKT
jgi:hypothetical protein